MIQHYSGQIIQLSAYWGEAPGFLRCECEGRAQLWYPSAVDPDKDANAPAEPGEKGTLKRSVGYGPQMGNATVPPALQDAEQRKAWGLGESEDDIGDYMVELNLLYKTGLPGAAHRFEELYAKVVQSNTKPTAISKTYFRCRMSVRQWRALINADEASGPRRERSIYKLWPDFPVRPLIDRSVTTVKADAAVRAYAATGKGITWAVIDSGIDGSHIHFGHTEKNPTFTTLMADDVRDLHKDFTGGNEPLVDRYGHGTHVAGIIAGGLPASAACNRDFAVFQNVFCSDPDSKHKSKELEPRVIEDSTSLRGVAPLCRLISLKVLNDDGAGRASDIMLALQYIREDLNGDPKMLRVQGVNLSVGYEFDAEMFACGQSPLCVEVDRLVKSGVVVVVAAGNTGYGRVSADVRGTKVGLSNTINDPGNANLSITVGATHRDSPHLYGVSYFSSKGPTGDGRLKPDLVAPGERITSCASGRHMASNGGDVPDGLPAYVDDTGTSMAAPHVSGAIAAFLSIRREFIQRPEEVKKIFLDSATPLGRERYFEGHGLVDLMRAIQSV
jgi:subtilisin family serine protease